MKKNVKNYKMEGFTLIELLLVMGISVLVFSVTMISVTPLIPKANSRAAIDILQASFAEQRMRAQSGYSDFGTPSAEHGIHFEENQYIFFEGSSYVPTNPSNVSYELEDGLRFTSITFPNGNLIFSAISGEVDGFVEGQNSVAITNDTLNSSQIISVNRYGVMEVE